MGRPVEPVAGDGDPVIRARWRAALLVALVAFGAAWLALMPGVAFWDTGELQAVAPLLGTAHPTGFPTYVLLGWLASVVLQPFGEPAFRMNLFSALCLAVAAGVTRRPGPGADRLGGARDRSRDRAGADAHRLGDRDPRRGALAPPGARGDPALAAGRPGTPARATPCHRRPSTTTTATRPPRPGRPRRPLPGRRRLRLRPGRRQPLADPPARDRRSASTSSRSIPGSGAAAASSCRASVALARHPRPRLPRAAAAGRAVPRRARVRHARTPGRASSTSSWPSSSRAA